MNPCHCTSRRRREMVGKLQAGVHGGGGPQAQEAVRMCTGRFRVEIRVGNPLGASPGKV